MISSDQIRAARALLNLSQQDLAAKAGITAKLLNDIEAGSARPRSGHLVVIKNALENLGIEFLDGSGIRRKGEALDIERIEGSDLLQHFYADILNALPKTGGEVLYMGVNNPRFGHYVEEKLQAYREFEGEAIERGIGERLLFLEGDTNFLSKRNGYRWIPRKLFGETPITIYGDNVSVILWGPPGRMIIIRNKAIAETLRCHFEAIWSLGEPVPDDIHEKHRVKDESETKV